MPGKSGKTWADRSSGRRRRDSARFAGPAILRSGRRGATSSPMSRYRRRVRDDLVDVVFDAIRTAVPETVGTDEASIRAQAEREAARQAAREEARRRREERGIRSFVGAGVGLLAGGVTSMMLPTVAAVGVGLLAGGAANFFVRLLQTTDLARLLPRLPNWPAPRQSIDPPEVDGRNLAKSQRDLVQGVLDDGAEHLRKLDGVARDLERADAAAAEICHRLVRAGAKLSDAVADEPTKFSIAQRVFTYHLPKAVFVAETFLGLHEQATEKRANDARHVLARMEMVFEKTLLDMSEVDGAEMDLEMRLINQSLDEDLSVGKDKP